MIGFLEGEIMQVKGGSLIVNVNNVGYRVEVGEVPLLVGQQIRIYVYTHVREQEITLYGFSDDKNLEMFEYLISVSGVGPKSALNILNEIGRGNLVNAIENSDPARIKVKGIGSKTSEKIIIELKGKVDHLIDNEVRNEINSINKQVYLDVFEALSSLGYRKAEIDLALKDIVIGEDDDVQMVVKRLLEILKVR